MRGTVVALRGEAGLATAPPTPAAGTGTTGTRAAVPVGGTAAAVPIAGTRVAPVAGARAAVPARLLGSGQVRPATGIRAGESVLPVHEALRGLLPDGGLRRGGTVAVAADTGGLSLLYALLAGPSADGAWCAAVGVPELGATAAAEYGVAPERLALVPEPGPDWLTVTAALLDGFGLVLVRPPRRAGGAAVTPTEVRRLAARARQRGTVLLVHGDWPGADVALRTRRIEWRGLGSGRGRLHSRAVTVDATGRGAAARPRSVRVLLPAGGTGTAAVAPAPEPALPEYTDRPVAAGVDVCAGLTEPDRRLAYADRPVAAGAASHPVAGGSGLRTVRAEATAAGCPTGTPDTAPAPGRTARVPVTAPAPGRLAPVPERCPSGHPAGMAAVDGPVDGAAAGEVLDGEAVS